MHNIFTRSSSLLIIILALPLLACRQEAPPTASPNASRYDLRGKVVSFDKARQEVTIAHEATVGKLSEEDVFYLMSRGLSEEEAQAMIVNGFLEPIVRELPLEYAVELNRLIELEMEGSVG